jgi:hypothetical protein
MEIRVHRGRINEKYGTEIIFKTTIILPKIEALSLRVMHPGVEEERSQQIGLYSPAWRRRDTGGGVA